MQQWRLINQGQSVSIDRFFEMIPASTTTTSTATNSIISNSGTNVVQQQQQQQQAPTSIVIAPSPANVSGGGGNIPILASIQPNTLINQPHGVVIVVCLHFSYITVKPLKLYSPHVKPSIN
jgi:hypothetical protein